MKILSLSLDRKILDIESSVAKRTVEYGSLVGQYDVLIPNNNKQEIKLSHNVAVYSSGGGSKMMQLVCLCKQASKILNKEKYHIITVQDAYYLGILAWLLKNKFKLALEIQIHGFEKYSGMRKILANFVIPRSDSLRVVSQRLRQSIIKKFNISKEKITVVPVYTENKKVNKGARLKKKDDKFIFLTVGRLVPVKNIEMQIEAMGELVKKYANIELWIVGEGELQNDLEVRGKKLEVSDKVKFFGWQDNLEKIYGQADVFLLTSNYEGWGMVIIEAASHGLPIIMTDVGCAGEVIANKESGIVIPIGDKRKLVEAMEDLCKNKGLREKLGREAAIAIKKLPTKEETLNLYLKSWEKAINKI